MATMILSGMPVPKQYDQAQQPPPTRSGQGCGIVTIMSHLDPPELHLWHPMGDPVTRKDNSLDVTGRDIGRCHYYSRELSVPSNSTLGQNRSLVVDKTTRGAYPPGLWFEYKTSRLSVLRTLYYVVTRSQTLEGSPKRLS